MSRSQSRLLLLAGVSVLSGFWLRFHAPVPAWLSDAAGGIAYVLFFVLVFGAFKPDTPARTVALAVVFVTCCLETLQLWHPAWLEAIRATLPGRLLLGTTFEWMDFPPYFLGAAFGWALLKFFKPRRKSYWN